MLLVLCSEASVAQQPAWQLSYHFKTDTISIAANKTFGNMLVITNQSSGKVRLVREGKNLNIDLAILKLPEEMILEAGQTKSFPLKYFSDQQTIFANIQRFDLKLVAPGQQVTVLPSAGFVTQLTDPGGLVMDIQSSEIYLDPLTNKAELQLRLFNNGLIPLTFDLDLTGVPRGLEFIGPRTRITLAAGDERMIPFMAINKSRTNAPADFLVIIKAMDPSSHEIATKRLRVMTVSSNRNLVLNEQNIYYQNRPNTVSLNYTTANNFNALQLFGAGTVELKNSHRMNYNLNMNYSPLSAGKLYTSDSYLEYSNKYWALRAGNIYANLDFNAYGRGAKASAFLGKNRSIQAYALDNNNGLFSGSGSSGQGGDTFALEYLERQEGGLDKSRLILLRNKDLVSARITHLISAKQLLFGGKDRQFWLGAGYSTLQLDHMRHKSFQGLGVELNYDQKFNQVSMSTANYYATPNYGGLRSGALYSDNTVTYSVDKNAVFSAKLSFMDNRPNYIAKLYNDYVKRTSQYGTQIYELGFEKSLGKYRLGIYPYYFSQQISANTPQTLESSDRWKSSSARIRLSLYYRDAFQSVDLRADNGYTYQNTSEMPPAPFFSSRVNLSYRNNIFGLNGFYQHNAFYISDALANNGGDNYNMFSIGPNISFSALQKRLSLTTSANYSYYGYNGTENYTINAYSRFLLKDQWALTMNLFYGLNRQERMAVYNPETGLDYNQTELPYKDVSYFSNRQFSFGIEKHFGSTSAKKTWKLKLTYFEDLDGNGVRDPGENVIPGILVKINKLAAISNSAGKVQFSAPSGEYQLSTINQKGWSAFGSNTVLISGDKQIDVAMVKTLKLTGVLEVIKDAYVKSSPSIAGVRVTAVAASGTLYTAVCDAEGEFSFYLPQGKYLVHIKNPGESLAVLQDKKEIFLTRGGPNRIDFKAKNTGVSVEVKDF